MAGKLENLALNKIPKKFQRLFNKGLLSEMSIFRVEFQNDGFSGQSKVEKLINDLPIQCNVTEKTKWREDQGGKWSSYLEVSIMFPLINDSDLVDIKTTDVVKIIETDWTAEKVVTNLKLSTPASAYYLIVGEIDNRDGQRVDGV